MSYKIYVPKPLFMQEVGGKNMVEIATLTNQALLDAAEWAGVSVWVIVGGLITALVILLLIAVRQFKQKPYIKVYATRGEAGDDALEFVEKTLVEFPADSIKIEATGGKVIISLISQKPMAVEEPHLPPEIRGNLLPSKVERPRPKEPAPEKKPKESKPIPMGNAKSVSENKGKKGVETTKEKPEKK